MVFGPRQVLSWVHPEAMGGGGLDRTCPWLTCCWRHGNWSWSPRAFQSGTGLPHSTTLRDCGARTRFRQVLECGGPVPLWSGLTLRAPAGGGVGTGRRRARQCQSGTTLPHSTTLRDVPARTRFRQVLECGGPAPLWSGLTLRAPAGGGVGTGRRRARQCQSGTTLSTTLRDTELLVNQARPDFHAQLGFGRLDEVAARTWASLVDPRAERSGRLGWRKW